MKGQNQKLMFINKADSTKFKQINKQETQSKDDEDNEEKENELPIIFHEREIMESLENNVVTIVCGETGSGKSTQIPQFILNNHRANPWKFRTNSNAE